jgi:hypothetical protein
VSPVRIDDALRAVLWRQFGAAIDMLENAITACPEPVWSDRAAVPEYWYTAYHTLFWLDFYLSAPVEDFRPPEPFGLEEMDPAGVLPPRVYSQAELLTYLEHGRNRCRSVIAGLDDAGGDRELAFGWGRMTRLELLLYNMRHVQHHAAQMNLLLRQGVDDAPRWVGITKKPCPGVPA